MSKTCKHCQLTFEDVGEYKKHIRGCSKTVTGRWSNGEHTVTSGTDGRLKCYCTNPRCAGVYQSVDGFKGHINATYEWRPPEVSVMLAQRP